MNWSVISSLSNETQVGTLPAFAVLEVKFLDRNGKRKLELEVEW